MQVEKTVQLESGKIVKAFVPEDMNVFPELGDAGLSVRELASLLAMHAIMSRKDFDWRDDARREEMLNLIGGLGETVVEVLKSE